MALPFKTSATIPMDKVFKAGETLSWRGSTLMKSESCPERRILMEEYSERVLTYSAVVQKCLRRVTGLLI